MPRTSRSQSDIDAVRHHILEETLKLLRQDGFNGLSMRKLAKRLDMTAANIYNYYSSKDELFLAVQTRGFQRLLEYFQDAYDSHEDPKARMAAMIDAYVLFGRQYPDVYDAMLNGNTPRYSDYVGTDIEPAAARELETAKSVLRLADKVADELEGRSPQDRRPRHRTRTMAMWFMLHGAVTLYNSRNIQQVDGGAEQMVAQVMESVKAELGLI